MRLAVTKNKLRPSSDNHAVSGARRVLHDFLCKLQYALAVNELEFVRVEASLITPAQKGFEEPVVERIVSLLSPRNDILGAIRQPGDFLRQQLIPKLPAEALRKLPSDFTASTSVLAFHCDDSDHQCFPKNCCAQPFGSPTTHTTLLYSFDGDTASAAWFILPQNKSQKEHDRRP